MFFHELWTFSACYVHFRTSCQSFPSLLSKNDVYFIGNVSYISKIIYYLHVNRRLLQNVNQVKLTQLGPIIIRLLRLLKHVLVP